MLEVYCCFRKGVGYLNFAGRLLTQFHQIPVQKGLFLAILHSFGTLLPALAAHIAAIPSVGYSPSYSQISSTTMWAESNHEG